MTTQTKLLKALDLALILKVMSVSSTKIQENLSNILSNQMWDTKAWSHIFSE